MALTDSGKLKLIVDGDVVITMKSISLKIDGKNQPIETLEGLQGFSDGSPSVDISGSGYVPIGGPEVDFFTNVANRGYHTVEVPVGGKSYRGQGKFMTSQIGQSTGAEIDIDFSWMGEAQPLE